MGAADAGDLLALAFERRARMQDPVGEMLWRVRAWAGCVRSDAGNTFLVERARIIRTGHSLLAARAPELKARLTAPPGQQLPLLRGQHVDGPLHRLPR